VAKALTFSPATIRRTAASLNSRLKTRGGPGIGPPLEDCHPFPCLNEGVHFTSDNGDKRRPTMGVRRMIDGLRADFTSLAH
jgi:hypothetical protein